MTRKRSSQGGRKFAVRLMEHLVVPTFVIDPARRVIIWNKACETLTGIAAEEVLGTRDHWRGFYSEPRYCLADIVALGRTEGMEKLYAAHARLDNGRKGFTAENWCVMPQARKRLYLAIDAGPIYDEDGELIAVVETLRDMTEQKMAQTALQSLAVKDGLTGLANRRAFDQTLLTEWLHARRERQSLALLLIDVDYFKAYNDTYGHLKGDQALRNIAMAIGAQAFRPSDVAARYGGEEFAVIMPLTELEGARQVAERIRGAVHALGLVHAGSTQWRRLTVSIGVAAAKPEGDESVPESLVAAADAALYKAKKSGRNIVVLDQPEPEEAAASIHPALSRKSSEGTKKAAPVTARVKSSNRS